MSTAGPGETPRAEQVTALAENKNPTCLEKNQRRLPDTDDSKSVQTKVNRNNSTKFSLSDKKKKYPNNKLSLDNCSHSYLVLQLGESCSII